MSTVMEGLYGDAFTLEASIAELKRKPFKPIGKSGMNAFGESVEFEDRGEMLRAILAIAKVGYALGYAAVTQHYKAA